eukprot:783174-Amphidinium_carterae.1
MTIESIKNLRTRARSGKNPEAEKQLEEYIEDNEKLDFKMKKKKRTKELLKNVKTFNEPNIAKTQRQHRRLSTSTQEEHESEKHNGGQRESRKTTRRRKHG